MKGGSNWPPQEKLPSKSPALLGLIFIFVLDENDMTQNNSGFVFARKTSNDNRGRSNLRIDMNQETNLKSLGFKWKKILVVQGVSTSFWSPYFCNRPFCGRRCCKTSICISCCREAGDSPVPTLWSSLLSSPLPPSTCIGEQFF